MLWLDIYLAIRLPWVYTAWALKQPKSPSVLSSEALQTMCCLGVLMKCQGTCRRSSVKPRQIVFFGGKSHRLSHCFVIFWRSKPRQRCVSSCKHFASNHLRPGSDRFGLANGHQSKGTYTSRLFWGWVNFKRTWVVFFVVACYLLNHLSDVDGVSGWRRASSKNNKRSGFGCFTIPSWLPTWIYHGCAFWWPQPYRQKKRTSTLCSSSSSWIPMSKNSLVFCVLFLCMFFLFVCFPSVFVGLVLPSSLPLSSQGDHTLFRPPQWEDRVPFKHS